MPQVRLAGDLLCGLPGSSFPLGWAEDGACGSFAICTLLKRALMVLSPLGSTAESVQSSHWEKITSELMNDWGERVNE